MNTTKARATLMAVVKQKYPTTFDPASNKAIFPGGTEVAVWKKGDITRLQIDVILVNAANDQEGGLGCFVPDHRCIDNVIHRGAGPRLRQACHEAMLAYRGGGYLLSGAGTPPIVTPAFFLPSNHVIHITGPHIRSGRSPTDVERHLLAKAYWGSLNKAAFLRVVLLLRTEE